MGFSGLREFLELLEAEGELARVRVPVDLNQELGAVCVKSLRAYGPALLFERPGDSDIPMLTNLLATRRRYALAMGCTPNECQVTWNRCAASPIPPVLVERGPCQENVLIGDEVDITRLPAAFWNSQDGGRYLTLSCHHTFDPTTGKRNVGIYRNQVHDRNTLGILAGPYQHISIQHRHAPDEPFPVAIAIGPDPRVTMVAATPLPFGSDELAMAGALRGAPLEVVRCKTVPIEVPADSEIVLEGEVRPNEKREEGHFGEFTGHYGGLRMPRTTIHITAMTFRNNPILHQAYQGAPPHETDVLTAVGKEAEFMRTIPLPGIKAVHLTEGGCGVLHLVIAVEKLYEGYGKMIGMAALGCPPGRHIKLVTVVDEDVDPYDPVAVEWAIATRVQAHRDVEIIKEVAGIFLDPSMPPEEQAGPGRTSKMIIDATRYNAKSFPPVCLPDATIMARVDEDWAKYGISLGGAAASHNGRAAEPEPNGAPVPGVEMSPRM
jgi:UbiD family decarboxylase